MKFMETERNTYMAANVTKDMTEGAIPPLLVGFTIPLVLGNLFQQLYNTADSLIVGNFLGSNALAAHRKPETYRANLCG